MNKQRRHAAANMVSSLWSTSTSKSNAMKKTEKEKAKAKRPMIQVQPGDIGPIQQPNENDVLCGRGGRINSHQGNVQFRRYCDAQKTLYLAKTTKKLEKAHIAADVVERVRSMDPPGRFLKEDPNTAMFWDIGDAKAIKKVGQCMREDAPTTREQLSTSGDETEPQVSVTIPLYPTNNCKENAPRKSKAMKAENPAEVSSDYRHYQQQRSAAFQPSASDNRSYSRMAMEVVQEQELYPEYDEPSPMVAEHPPTDAFGRNFHPAPSSNLSTGMSSLLEQSIISGISDGVSSLTFGDEMHRKNSMNMYNHHHMHAPSNQQALRKRRASGGGGMSSMHPRKLAPKVSPIQRANPVQDDCNSLMSYQNETEQDHHQRSTTTRSHLSDMSTGAFSVSMASLPSIGSVASVSI